MLVLQSQTVLKSSELLASDIKHTNTYDDFSNILCEEESYSISNFLTEDERNALIDFFFSKFKYYGLIINSFYRQITHPIKYPLVNDILRKKILSFLGEDTVFYSDVSKDEICVGDHFYLMKNVYTPHTDSITHIPGYIPYKDIVIPLEIEKDVEDYFYTCKQRYYGRATHFKYSWHTDYFSNYANTIKFTTYKDYGVKYVEEDSKPIVDWYKRKMGNCLVPVGVFQGLSIAKEFKWIPGSAIVQDPSVIHGPTNFRSKGAKWKLGLVFHLLKKHKEFNYEVSGYPTRFSFYTLPFKKLESSSQKLT